MPKAPPAGMDDSERAAALRAAGTNVTDYVAHDGSNNIAITADVSDPAGRHQRLERTAATLVNGRDLDPRIPQQTLEPEGHRSLHQAINRQRPATALDPGNSEVAQHDQIVHRCEAITHRVWRGWIPLERTSRIEPHAIDPPGRDVDSSFGHTTIVALAAAQKREFSVPSSTLLRAVTQRLSAPAR